MSDTSPSPIRGSVYLIILALLGLAMAVYFLFTGVRDLWHGLWFSPAGGGLSAVVMGAAFLAGGLLLLRRGVRAYRFHTHNASSAG